MQEELQEFAESLKGTNGLACMAKSYKVSAEFLRSIVYAADADGDGCVPRAALMRQLSSHVRWAVCDGRCAMRRSVHTKHHHGCNSQGQCANSVASRRRRRSCAHLLSTAHTRPTGYLQPRKSSQQPQHRPYAKIFSA